MDSQGFTGQTVKDSVKNAAGYVQPGVAGLSANKTRLAMNDALGIAHANTKPDPTDAKIAGLHTFQNRMDNLTFGGEFFGMIGGGVLGWVARTANSSKAVTVVRAIFSAPFEALRDTKLNNLAELPANYMRKIAKHADESAMKMAEKSIRSANKTLAKEEIDALVGKRNFKTMDYTGLKGTGSHQWVSAAEQKAASLDVWGKNVTNSVSEAVAPVTKPLRSAIRNGLDSFEATGVGKSADGSIQKLVSWRMERSNAHFSKHIDKAHAALTTETHGFQKKIISFFTGKKPAEFGAHPELQEVTQHLTKARAATTGAERVIHTDAAANALQKLAGASEESLKNRVSALTEMVQKSGAAAGALHGLENAEGRGLSTVVKSLGKSAGRIPLFGAIMGVGAVAGITAAAMTHRKDGKAAKEAEHEIASVIGHDHPLMHSIQQAYSAEKYKRTAKTGFSMLGDVANVAMGVTPGGGGMAMMGAMMVPMVGTMMIKENALLNAYANLRHEEKTGKKMAPEEKLELTRQLVSGVPSVAAHGGYYNRLTSPVAEAVMDKNLSALDTMKLLADDQKFTALASEVQEKQKALMATPAETAPAVVANDNHEVAVAPHLTAGSGVSVSSVAHDGRVSGIQRTASI